MLESDAGLPPEVGPPWEELAGAHRLLRRVAVMLDRVAADEGWPVPRPSSLAHHLDVLEEAALIARRPGGLHDRRKVAVRLTGDGRDALWRLGSVLERPTR